LLDHGYRRALVEAGYLADTPYGKGVQAWRSAGLRSAKLLAHAFGEQVQDRFDATFLTHPTFSHEAEYRALFSGHDNFVALALDGRRVLVRPDFLLPNLRHVLARGSDQPVIAFGGLLRATHGRMPPAFKDRYIWPAVQLNQAVPRGDGPEVLRVYAGVLAALLRRLCLPGVVVRSAPAPDYSAETYLAVSCLPDGSLTVLSTLYTLEERFRRFLGTDRDLVDIGITGKVLAVAAMHHRDARGLRSPSALAPVQALAIPCGPASVSPLESWAAELGAQGLRAEVAPAAGRSATWRTERRGRRRGIPVLLSHDAERPDPVVLGLRTSEARADEPRLPDAERVRSLLALHDERLRERAARRWDGLVARGGALMHLCAGCASRHPAQVLGEVHPLDWTTCRCGAPRASLRLLTDRPRIY
jgi:hypothetical protein